MTKTLPSLATSAEVRGLAARALEILEAHGEQDEEDRDSPLEDDGEEQADAAFRAAREALRFCAAAAAQLGDAGLLPLLARIHAELEYWDDHALGHRATVLEGVTALLRAGAPVEEAVEELAEHHDPSVRAAVAEGLPPHGPRATALLSKLALDPSADVRNPAKAALAKTGEVSWWTGKFESDPVARLTPDEAMAHKEALEELSTLLDLPYYELIGRDADLARVVASLPDALAVEASRLALCAGGRHAGMLPQLGAAMIARPGGIDALIRACEVWSRARYFHPHAEHVRIVAAAPPHVRLEACLALARYAATAPEPVRAKQSGPAHIAAEMAGKAFPSGADLGPLCDVILGTPDVPEFTLDWSVAGLRHAFDRPDADPTTIAARIVEARLAGFPGRWRALHTAILGLLQRLPRATLRAAAEEAVRRDDDNTVGWGLGRLLFEAHDPQSDPDPLTMVRRFCEEPRLRKVLVEGYEVRHATVAVLREELRRSALALPEAIKAVEIIDDLWGGRAQGMHQLFPHAPDDSEKKRAALRDRFAAFLGPEALHGPVTEGEWAALRHARASHADFTAGHFMGALQALPPGPWHAEDRALLDRAVVAAEAESHIVHFIALALAAKPDADLLPLFRRLVRVAPGDRDTLKRSYFAVRDALGLRAPATEDAGGPAAPREWMDEPEDEEGGDD